MSIINKSAYNKFSNSSNNTNSIENIKMTTISNFLPSPLKDFSNKIHNNFLFSKEFLYINNNDNNNSNYNNKFIYMNKNSVYLISLNV